MRLPPELQTRICENLTKAELKGVRLICKSIDQAAVPFLFDEVFVTARYADLDIADLVVSRFGSYVMSITLSCVEYESLTIKDYRERVNMRTCKRERWDGHTEHAFEVYRKLQRENLEINESGELMARLCLMLSKSPSARKIVLTDCGNNDVYGVSHLNPHDPWKNDDLCPFKACTLSLTDHLSFYLRPNPPYQQRPNPLHLAMLATTTAKHIIKELIVIHDGVGDYDTENSCIEEVTFAMTIRQSCCLTLQFQHLTKLRLRLSDDDVDNDARRSDSDYVVARALSSAVNLESLCIETLRMSYPVGHVYVTRMHAWLESCRFPRLTILILKSMTAREEELLEFLKNSPRLEHLTLEDLTLIPGSWENVAERIRSMLRLTSVMLHDIAGKPRGSTIDHEELICDSHHHLIEDFFLRNGKNPFTEAALKDRSNEDYVTMREVYQDLRKTRYQMFN